MVDDTTKKGLLEWLFGKSALDKAAGVGDNSQNSPIYKNIKKDIDNSPPPAQSNDYIRKQIEATQKQKPILKPMPNATPEDAKGINLPRAKPKPSKDALDKLYRGNNDY